MKPSGKNKTKQVAAAAPSPAVAEAVPVSFSWTSLQGLSIILMGIALLIYGNTLFNDYALDDGLVFIKNDLVKKGFSGIGGILSHDSFYGGLGDAYKLNGGRWRPLSLISFAVEYQLFGLIPWISHLINVLLYALTGVLLMKFCEKHVFRGNLWLSFFTAFLFIIHPIHTEVVANIKGRDELFSLLLLILALHYFFNWAKENEGAMALFKALICYSLAMLSKENGLTFVFIFPVSLFFFSKASPSKIISSSLPFIAVAFLYIVIRVKLIGFSTAPITELLDNPYMMATFSEKIATILYVFLYYLRLLIFPHPLTYDYSYNQIPFHSFGDAAVILSALIHLGLAAYVVMRWKKKDKIVWCILFYVASIFIVSNMFINVGAFLAERFLYQPSIAFCLAIVLLIRAAIQKIAGENVKLKTQLAVGFTVVIFIPAAAKTITRNGDWKNDTVLFIHDEKVSTNSARAATYAGIRYTVDSDTIKDPVKKKECLQKSLELYYRSYGIYPNSASNYLNWGVLYSRMDSLDRAEWAWNEARKITPSSTMLAQYDKYLGEVYYKRGLYKGLKKDENFDLKQSIALLKKATVYDSANADYWYNLGGAYFTNGQRDSAIICWEKTISIDPNNPDALRGLNALRK